MTRKIKRGGKVWINVFPDKPYTKKPAETRMGSGKGNPEGWVAVVKPGKVMFELAGVPEDLAKEAMRLAGHKLPIRTKFVRREGAESLMKGGRGPQPEGRRAGGELIDAKRGGVQPALPPRDRRAREHRRASAAAGATWRRLLTVAQGARHRPRERAEELMADEEKKDAAAGDAPGRGAQAAGPVAEEDPRRGGCGRGRPPTPPAEELRPTSRC